MSTTGEPIWLDKPTVIDLHWYQIKRFGGAEGATDPNTIKQNEVESAINSPPNQYHYACETDILRLAAFYTFKLIQNHPFIDGNKRTGIGACVLFLRVNGKELACPSETLKEMALKIGRNDGSISIEDFVDEIKVGIKEYKFTSIFES